MFIKVDFFFIISVIILFRSPRRQWLHLLCPSMSNCLNIYFWMSEWRVICHFQGQPHGVTVHPDAARMDNRMGRAQDVVKKHSLTLWPPYISTKRSEIQGKTSLFWTPSGRREDFEGAISKGGQRKVHRGWRASNEPGGKVRLPPAWTLCTLWRLRRGMAP